MARWVWEAALGWYGVVSVIALVLYWRDKRAARRGRWRTPERMLHFAAFMGGWPGALLAQRLFHHKTRKKWFRAITYAIVLVHLAGWIAIWFAMR